LQPFAAALAHQRMDTARLSQLRSLLEEIRGAGERGDFVRVSERDALFHQLIWRESRDGLLASHRVLLAVLEEGDSERVRNTFREILLQFPIPRSRSYGSFASHCGSSSSYDCSLRPHTAMRQPLMRSKPSRRPRKQLTITSATEIWQAFLAADSCIRCTTGPDITKQ